MTDSMMDIVEELGLTVDETELLCAAVDGECAECADKFKASDLYVRLATRFTGMKQCRLTLSPGMADWTLDCCASAMKVDADRVHDARIKAEIAGRLGELLSAAYGLQQPKDE